MKILVIGSGGREHAIVWKLSQSKRVQKIYCAPGNGGIQSIAECVDIKSDDLEGLLEFAKCSEIDMTVVGPEVPLSLGIVDLFNSNGLRIFGPRKKAALLEASKAFSKDFMQRNGIPTAKYNSYTDKDKALKGLADFGLPVVIKADGLAAGKGVIIAQAIDEAAAAVNEIMEDKKFGIAGGRIVIEEFLEGREASILAFVDGKTAVPMADAQDYKRALDNDKGLNTGGMGAVSPSFNYNDHLAGEVQSEIIDKTVKALRAEGIEYKGVLYFGLMLTEHGVKVLEYNARFGDPETEAVLPRLETDLLDIIEAVIDGTLSQISIKWSRQKAVCAVMASGGYPEEYKTGYKIEGLDKLDKDIIVLHAGTKLQDDEIVTAGGRVLVLTALAEDTKTAVEKLYANIERIDFIDKYYRKDIGLE